MSFACRVFGVRAFVECSPSLETVGGVSSHLKLVQVEQALWHGQAVLPVQPKLFGDEHPRCGLGRGVVGLLAQSDQLLSLRIAIGAARPQLRRGSVLPSKLKSYVIPVQEQQHIGVIATHASSAQRRGVTSSALIVAALQPRLLAHEDMSCRPVRTSASTLVKDWATTQAA